MHFGAVVDSNEEFLLPQHCYTIPSYWFWMNLLLALTQFFDKGSYNMLIKSYVYYNMCSFFYTEYGTI